MAFSLGEYGDIFLEEADEQLQELNHNLIELEKNPKDPDIINNIFRAAHSLKSSAAFVGLNDLSDLAHKMENLLQGIRDKTMEVTPDVINVIFKCFDSISEVIGTVSAGEEPHQNLSWLIGEILILTERASGKSQAKTAEIKPAAPVKEEAPQKTDLTQAEVKLIRRGLADGKNSSEITVYLDQSAQMKWVKAQLILANLEGIGDIIRSIPPQDGLTDEALKDPLKVVILTAKSIDDIKRACDIDQVLRVDIKSLSFTKKDDRLVLKIGKPESVINDEAGSFAPSSSARNSKTNSVNSDSALNLDEDYDAEPQDRGLEEPSDADKKRGGPVFKTVKVSIDKLDQLLNNVGELVTANSGFYKLYDELRKLNLEKAFTNDFKNRIEQMSRIAKDLQNGIMNTRMVPIGQVFSRFNRLVRDLTKEFNKNIELIVKGEDTELDKKVIDVIGEPLMHLLRNALDHGVESAEDRIKAGKSEIARVTMNAYQSGNQIFVEVSDDGHGLNPAVIKKKALEKGLATPEMLEAMDNSDIYNFIFAPGFSTAKKITDISGRGVGMNVVKETVSELNGSVSIETELGMGTRFIMAFPLTLAIIPAIMVRVKNEMYAIPLSDVLDTIKIQNSEITTVEGHEVINFRGEILSIIRLNYFIGIKSALSENQKIPVVVVSYGNRKIGLLVDYLEGKQEIVIKSLEQNYKTVHGLAGASILGDGSICLILDISSMINMIIQNQDRYLRRREELLDVEDDAPAADAPKIMETKAEPEDAVKNVKVLQGAASSNKEGYGTAILFDEPTLGPDDSIEANIIEREIAPVSESISEAMPEQRVHEALEQFRTELKENIKNTLSKGAPNEHMISALSLSNEDLVKFQIVANVGAANAAEALSKILDKRIDLSIPDVTIKPLESIPEYLGDPNGSYMGVMLAIEGEAKGSLLFIFAENAGFDLINLLYGTTIEHKELTEDGESALKEVTNIVGSSVINVFAEKSGLAIKPSIPHMVHDFLQSIIDSILAVQNKKNDYAIVMDTAFYYENDQVIGNLLIMPEAESLKLMTEKLR